MSEDDQPDGLPDRRFIQTQRFVLIAILLVALGLFLLKLFQLQLMAAAGALGLAGAPALLLCVGPFSRAE